MSEPHHQPHLTKWIILAIVLAIVAAMFAPTLAMSFSIGGEIFLQLLKMIVVPLVVASVMAGVLGMGDVRQLGRPGFYMMVYFLATTLLAVILGMVIVNVVRPGHSFDQQTKVGLTEKKGANQVLYQHLAEETGLSDDAVANTFGDSDYVERKDRSVGRIVRNLVLMLFTDNLFESAVGMQLLPLIVFSIAFAGMLTTMDDRVNVLTTFIRQTNDALMTFILLIMRFAPIGIFCLVAGRFGLANAEGKFLDELRQTGWYSASVLVGLAIHSLITLPALLYFFTKRNPYRFIVQMGQALLTAFSTASSSATLPLTMEAAVDEAGISRQSVDFVVPLGATINMNGTALYEAVAAMFIAQVIGADLSFAQQLTVAVTATLAAIGAAGIPEAGLVTMVIVLTAVGLPVEYMTIILSVDWLLDRFRTTVNVFGDACGAAIVEKSMPTTQAAS